MSLLSFLNKDQKDEPKVSASITEANARAAKCLSMPEFEEYRKRFEKAEAGILDELIVMSVNYDGDISKFGARCLAKLTRLRDLRALLTFVNADSQKGKPGE